MTLSLNLADDYLVWDNLEAVSLRTISAPGIATIPDVTIASAMRRAPTFRELSAANGAYTGQDLVWEVPHTLISSALAQTPQADRKGPKPGDMIIAGSDTWTILEAALEAVGSVWRLVTRNMVIVWNLRDVISIEQATITYDETRAAVRTFPPTGGSIPWPNIAARVQPQEQAVADERGHRGRQLRATVIVGQQLPGFDVRECRIKWKDVYGIVGTAGTFRYLDCERFHDSQQIAELPKIEAVLKV